jgi:hypothetical protein
MNLQELLKKYPNLKSCVEVLSGEEFLNMKKVNSKINTPELSKDLEKYTGYVILNNNDYYDGDEKYNIINS